MLQEVLPPLRGCSFLDGVQYSLFHICGLCKPRYVGETSKHCSHLSVCVYIRTHHICIVCTTNCKVCVSTLQHTPLPPSGPYIRTYLATYVPLTFYLSYHPLSSPSLISIPPLHPSSPSLISIPHLHPLHYNVENPPQHSGSYKHTGNLRTYIRMYVCMYSFNW